MRSHAEVAQVLKAVFEGTAGELIIELRVVHLDGGPNQRFYRVSRLATRRFTLPELDQFDGKANVYYSVIPRTRRSGVAAACGPAQAVWADFDLGAPSALPLPPSMVVETSPSRYQAYWCLRRATTNLEWVENINMSIAFRHGGDSRCCDRARVLRLPGFQNLKYPARPYARLLVCRLDRRFVLEELEEAYPPPVRSAVSILPEQDQRRDAPNWLRHVFDALLDFLDAGGFSPRRTDTNGGVIVR